MPENGIEEFLEQAGWGGGQVVGLAGDASHRRYDRVLRNGSSAVLMIAPPEKGEDTRPFIRVAEHLSSIGLGAPEIYASDTERGLLLLEDLGDDLYARIAHRAPEMEGALYQAAIDVLVRLHSSPVPEWCQPYGTHLMVELAGLATIWYAGNRADEGAFFAELEPLLDALLQSGSVLALRDYHAENLIWRSDRNGLESVGLIDFQDAMACHPAYDLVSLLEDARRDLGNGLREAMIGHYCNATGQNPAALEHAIAVLGAQRNLRILGVFARLCLRDGKPHYVDLIPRVWAHLMRDLSHPALADLRSAVMSALPEPTEHHLSSLKARCSSHPQMA